MRELRTVRLGEARYARVWRLQQDLHARRVADEIGDTLLLLSHPRVITAGRAEGRADIWRHLRVPSQQLEADGVDLVESNRGGDLTYHGPGQVVAYLILKLEEGDRDIGRFVTMLEETQRLTLLALGIDATRDPNNRGVWVGNNKIGAVGARVRAWTTMHGISLNVRGPLEGFEWIVPCGLADRGITSIERELLPGKLPSDEQIDRLLADSFAAVFDRVLRWVPVPEF
jgi:lipoyl(octanoyl) transferase